MIPSFIRQIQTVRIPLAYVLLGGVICGIIAAGSWGWGILFAVAGCGLLCWRKNFIPALFFLLLSLLGAFREASDYANWSVENKRSALPSGSVRFLVTDPDAPGNNPCAKSLSAFRVLLVRRIPEGDYYRLNLPQEESRQFQFGDEVRVTGYATQPAPVPIREIRADGSEKQRSRGASTFASYLRSHNIKGTFYAISVDAYRTGDRSNWSWREFLLAAPIQWRSRLCEAAQVQCNSYAKTLIGGMIFGYRGALPQLQNLAFARAGIIHVLTVSGMHVMMVAGLLLLLFRFLPLRIRYLPAALGALAYVFAVGMPVPAVRAWVLFAAFAAGRILLRQAPSCVILALTATGLLLVTPGLLADAGFHYTFLVTAILILAAEQSRQFFAAYGFGRPLWDLPIAYPSRQRLYRGIKNTLSTLFLYGCACSASSIITLFHRGTFRAMTFAANLAVLLVVGPFFLLTVLKLLLFPLVPTFYISFLLNLLANCLFAFLDGIDGSLTPECLAIPGPAATGLLLLLLVILIRCFGKLRPMLAIGSFLLVVWCAGIWVQSSKGPVFGRIDGDDGTDTLFAASPVDGECVIVNPPRGGASTVLVQILEELSISRAIVLDDHTLWGGVPATAVSGGLTAMTLRSTTQTAMNCTLPEFTWGENPEASVVRLEGADDAVAQDGRWQISSKKSTVFLEYRENRGNSSFEYQRNSDGTWQMIVIRQGKPPAKYGGWRRSRMGVELYE